MAEPSGLEQWQPLPSFDPIIEAFSFIEQNSVMRPLRYSLDCNLNEDTLGLSVRADIMVQMTKSAERLPLVLSAGLQVADVSVDSDPCGVERSGDKLWLELRGSLPAGSTPTCSISYQGRLPSAYVIREDTGLWIELSPQAFWYPFASFDVTSTIPFGANMSLPGSLVAASNGSLLEEKRGASDVRYTWSSPGDTYGYAVLAGPYATRQASHEGVTVRTYIRPDMADQAAEVAATLTRIAGVYADRFGSTSVGEISLVVPPHSVGGNWALGNMIVAGQISPESDHARIFGILAHELGHQWWGHTVRFDFSSALWLAEGLTAFSELSARLELEGTSRTREQLAEWTLPRYAAAREAGVALADCRGDSPRSHELREDGAAVFLALLRGRMGPTEFDRRLKTFFNAHAGREVTSDAFVTAVTADSSKPVGRFVERCLHSVPLPEVTADDVLAGLGGE